MRKLQQSRLFGRSFQAIKEDGRQKGDQPERHDGAHHEHHKPVPEAQLVTTKKNASQHLSESDVLGRLKRKTDTSE